MVKKENVTHVACGVALLVLWLSPRLGAQEGKNVELVGRALFGAANAVFLQDRTAYVGAGTALLIFDVSDPTHPTKLGHVYLPDLIQELVVQGNYAYVAEYFAGLWIVDVSDKRAPRARGFIKIPGVAQPFAPAVDVAVQDRLAYVAAEIEGLFIIDVSDPDAPVQIGHIFEPFTPTGAAVTDVAVLSTLAYVTTEAEILRIVDTSDPREPKQIGVLNTRFSAGGLDIEGNLAYISAAEGLSIIDVSVAQNPRELSLLPVKAGPIEVQGSTAYVSAWGGDLMVVDISDPKQPKIVTSLPGMGGAVSATNELLLLGQEFEGIKLIAVLDPSHPSILSAYDTGSRLWAVRVRGDLALITSEEGLQILSVTDPGNPLALGVFSSSRGVDADMDSTFAYLAAGIDGLYVLDISAPTRPQVAALITPDDARRAFQYYEVQSFHQVRVLDTRWAITTVVVGFERSAVITLDISDPTAPRLISIIILPGSSPPTDLSVDGDRAYIVNNILNIIDLSNPSYPVYLGSFDKRFYALYVHGSDSLAYMISFYGMSILNVADPSSPREIAFLAPPGAFGSSFFVGVDLSWPFALGATDARGLRVIDISRPTDPREVASFHVPYALTDVFYSAEQGLVYLTTTSSGLYVLRLDRRSLDVGSRNEPMESVFALYQNYPNPFNAATKIAYSISQPGFVTLKIYDVLGRLVRTVVQDYLAVGRYHITWDGKDAAGKSLPGGVYEYKLQVGSFTQSRKLVLLR